MFIKQKIDFFFKCGFVWHPRKEVIGYHFRISNNIFFLLPFDKWIKFPLEFVEAERHFVCYIKGKIGAKTRGYKTSICSSLILYERNILINALNLFMIIFIAKMSMISKNMYKVEVQRRGLVKKIMECSLFMEYYASINMYEAGLHIVKWEYPYDI